MPADKTWALKMTYNIRSSGPRMNKPDMTEGIGHITWNLFTFFMVHVITKIVTLELGIS